MSLQDTIQSGMHALSRKAKTAALATTAALSLGLGAQDAHAQQSQEFCPVDRACTTERTTTYQIADVRAMDAYAVNGADTIPATLGVIRDGPLRHRVGGADWGDAILHFADGTPVVAGTGPGAFPTILIAPGAQQDLYVTEELNNAFQGRSMVRGKEMMEFTFPGNPGEYRVASGLLVRETDCCTGKFPGHIITGPAAMPPDTVTVESVREVPVYVEREHQRRPARRPEREHTPESTRHEHFTLAGGLTADWTEGTVQNNSGIPQRRGLEEQQSTFGGFAHLNYNNDKTDLNVMARLSRGTYTQHQPDAGFTVEADLQNIVGEASFARNIQGKFGVGANWIYTQDGATNVRLQGQQPSGNNDNVRKEHRITAGPSITHEGLTAQIGVGGYHRSFDNIINEPTQTGLALHAGARYNYGPIALNTSFSRAGEEAVRAMLDAGVNLRIKGIGVHAGVGMERRISDEDAFTNTQNQVYGKLGASIGFGGRK